MREEIRERTRQELSTAMDMWEPYSDDGSRENLQAASLAAIAMALMDIRDALVDWSEKMKNAKMM